MRSLHWTFVCIQVCAHEEIKKEKQRDRKRHTHIKRPYKIYTLCIYVAHWMVFRSLLPISIVWCLLVSGFGSVIFPWSRTRGSDEPNWCCLCYYRRFTSQSKGKSYRTCNFHESSRYRRLHHNKTHHKYRRFAIILSICSNYLPFSLLMCSLFFLYFFSFGVGHKCGFTTLFIMLVGHLHIFYTI